MKRANWAALLFLAAFWFVPAVANAQVYEPTVGQRGKDVIWVPTPEELIEAMLDAAAVTPDDFVVDLGSGDGRIVIAAAKRGATALGIEYNPDMVALSIHNAEEAGVSDKASFKKADIFETDFSRATVVTMYLLPHLNLKLRPAILNLKPGTRIVSHAFDMGDWTPDKTIEKENRTAYLWIVPAKVEGSWKCRTGSDVAELELSQSYQNIRGTEKIDGKDLEIKSAKLNGNQISFSDGTREYSGRVNGRSIEGIVKANGLEQHWSASLQ